MRSVGTFLYLCQLELAHPNESTNPKRRQSSVVECLTVNKTAGHAV